MGASNNKFRVISLNYSGIFVSPFQFYALDNWQELQKIGLIFQKYLKQQYYDLKLKIKSKKKQKMQEKPGKKHQEEDYQRKQFSWQMQQFDKKIKYGRYSPLYMKQEASLSQKNLYKDIQMYPGIRILDHSYNYKQIFYFNTYQQYKKFIQEEKKLFKTSDQCAKWQKKSKTFQNQKQYQQSWQKDIQIKSKKQKTNNNQKKLQQQMACRFDFFCYRAIIEYLFNMRENKMLLWKDNKDFNQNNYYQFKQIIRQINIQEDTDQFVRIYCNFMNKYFEIIDVQKKINITMNNLYKKNKIDIINFQEGNLGLRKAFQALDTFYTLGPTNQKSQDQSLLIFRRDLPFIPLFYKQNYKDEQQAIDKLKQKLKETLKSAKQFSEHKSKDLLTALQNHFKPEVYEKIKKQFKIDQTNQQTFKQSSIKFTKIVYLYLGNPLKLQIDQWLQKYQKFFFEQWQKKKQNLKDNEKKQAENFLKNAKVNGLLFFEQSLMATNFTFTYKKLIDKSPQQNKIILMNIHLSSKVIRNQMQSQVVGLLVYELLQKNYKFILSGDFNAYLTLKQKQKQNGLFTFLIEYEKQHPSKYTIKQLRSKIQQKMNIYPKHNKIFTTKKKRTILQVQTRKINELKQVCIDQIISNFPIHNQESYTGDINYLGNKQNKNKQFLPHKEHPYDHYVVETFISIDLQNLHKKQI